MHTFLSLLNDLEDSGINPKSTVMVHSSMKAIGDVEGRGETVLDVLMAYMRDGLLLLPTHSWDDNNLKDGLFDPTVEKSCVGILSNLFMQREETIRSLHPSHSVTAYGERAATYTSKDTMEVYTPCPRGGCFGSLIDEDAQILFLGAPLTTNTYIHSIEEWLDIPDRLNPDACVYKVKDYDGVVKEVVYRGHKSSFGDVSKNYDKIEPLLIEKGFAKVLTIGDAKCYLVDVKPMTDLVIGILRDNPHYFDTKDS